MPAISKFDALPRRRRSGPSAFLSVQEGCDKFCTFCVVPYTRGAETSRPVQAVLDEARRIAQTSHPAIGQSQRQAAAAEIGVAAAAAERNPTLSGTASVGVARAPRASLGGDDGTRNSSSVGLELSQTLYSGGRLSAGHRRAMAERDQARSALLNTARQISQQVGETWANIAVARAQITAINQQISAAQQAYDGVREEALLGARTTLDVLDAEQSLLEARASARDA